MSEQTYWEKRLGNIPRYDKEIPVEGKTWLLEENRPPATAMEALMCAAPFQEPEESLEEINARELELLDKLDYIAHFVLSEAEREVIEVTVYAGHSIRHAAEILGLSKSTVHRLHISALKIIRRELQSWN